MKLEYFCFRHIPNRRSRVLESSDSDGTARHGLAKVVARLPSATL